MLGPAAPAAPAGKLASSITEGFSIDFAYTLVGQINMLL
jgi:hypothetical protein